MRTGLLYRSGDLADVSADDLETLANLGIRTIVDLRTLKEGQRHPDRPIHNHDCRTIRIPIKASSHNDSAPIWQVLSYMFGKGRNNDYKDMMMRTYAEYAARFQDSFGRLVRLAADPANLPILVHCTAGKDRTGFAVSLIQRALGIPHKLVLDHYMASNASVKSFQETMRKRYSVFPAFEASFEKFTPLMEVHQEYLQAAYDLIDRQFGTLDSYLKENLGITMKNLAALERSFLD